jgi:predicted Fe-S protein YdhL (DUF1289 family)
MASVDTGIETPCVSVCVVHPALKMCMGCGRSLDEIAGWIDFDAAERARIMAQLPRRLAATTGATPGATTSATAVAAIAPVKA